MDSFKNNDPFKQFVKGKLANYEKEMPHSSWEKLEESLSAAQKPKIVPFKRWLIPAVGAIAAALIGVFFVLQDTTNELPTQTSQYQNETINKEDNKLANKKERLNIEDSSSSLITSTTSSVKQKTSSVIKAAINKDEILSKGVLDNDSDKKAEAIVEEQLINKDKSDDIDEETKEKMIQDFIDAGKEGYVKLDDTEIKTSQKSNFTVALSGRSSLFSSQEKNTSPMTLRSSLDDSYSAYTIGKMKAFNKEDEVKPKSKISHNQPISFGVLTSFRISKRLELESGLMYTYLSSETANTSTNFNNSEKVQFHYLGIPVNLNYMLLPHNKLDVYVSAGAMIEKDIYGTIKSNDNKQNSLLNSEHTNIKSSKISQKNPQFSLSAGLGVSYPIYDRTALFGKIGGRYYINANNEFKTYYSDEKFGLDIQLGIKLNF